MTSQGTTTRPWAAVWSMLIGFFMLMIDSLIVSVANPTIQRELDASLTATIWVTSAYMLAIAVPLLVSGRLGDRFGQKSVFMVGMALFTLASLGCGLSNSIVALIVARVVQGVGGALMTPQTQAVIVRLFPPTKRGAPMGVWGSVSGVAMLIAPLLGGVLVDHLGWQSIFLVNLPIGVVGLILVAVFVPKLPGTKQKFDWVGVALSGVGLLLLVFAIQEGAAHEWGVVFGPITIWEMIIVAVVVLVVFVWWEAVGASAPLVPTRLFRHRDFAVASAATMCVGFVVSSMPLALLYFLQLGRGYSAVDSAWFSMPSAVVSGVLAPIIGAKLIHRLGARVLAPIGLVLWALGLWWMSLLATPDSTLAPWMLLASAVVGLGNACVWSPLSVVATRDLPHHEAGAGASVYNTARQIGSVLGAACVSTLMSARITVNLRLEPTIDERFADQAPTSFAGADLAQFAQLMRNNPVLAQWFQGHFTAAMGQSMWLPLAMALVGAAVAACVTSQPKITVVQNGSVGS